MWLWTRPKVLFHDSHNETHKGHLQLSHSAEQHSNANPGILCEATSSGDMWRTWPDVSIPPTSSHARTHRQQRPNQINIRDMIYTSRSWEMKSLLASSPLRPNQNRSCLLTLSRHVWKEQTCLCCTKIRLLWDKIEKSDTLPTTGFLKMKIN